MRVVGGGRDVLGTEAEFVQVGAADAGVGDADTGVGWWEGCGGGGVRGDGVECEGQAGLVGCAVGVEAEGALGAGCRHFGGVVWWLWSRAGLSHFWPTNSDLLVEEASVRGS